MSLNYIRLLAVSTEAKSAQAQEHPLQGLHRSFRNEKKLWDLIFDNKFDEAREFLDRLTSQHKTAAVNCKNRSNMTTLMCAATLGAPLTLIQRLCEIGGKQFIMATNDFGQTALHYTCQRRDPNIDTVKYLVETGGTELIKKKNKEGETPLDYAKRKEK